VVQKTSSPACEFTNKKDSEIVEAIGRKKGLATVVDPTTEQRKKVVKKQDTSLFNFLKDMFPDSWF
jgi:phage protein D